MLISLWQYARTSAGEVPDSQICRDGPQLRHNQALADRANASTIVSDWLWNRFGLKHVFEQVHPLSGHRASCSIHDELRPSLSSFRSKLSNVHQLITWASKMVLSRAYAYPERRTDSVEQRLFTFHKAEGSDPELTPGEEALRTSNSSSFIRLWIWVVASFLCVVAMLVLLVVYKDRAVPELSLGLTVRNFTTFESILTDSS